uniref:class I tRNA ligase family protein n=1 Tax=Alloprevotella sp. TaxID=1872471 RepID=UPI0040258AAF
SGGYVVAETEQEALALAREKSGNPALQLSDLKQDEDALDTWFSSWLWPISLFNGILDPDNEEFKYYYPTSVLVTGPDIIFFWVARMIMAGYEYTGKFPFKDVYFTGIVRDKLGRKMSKSLGNSPDPLDLIDKYGADGVRMGMMLSAPAGNDILFDESLCEQGRNFCNKIWNAFRLVQGWTVCETLPQNDVAALAINWFGAQMRSSAAVIADHFSKYRLSDALMEVYHLFWDEFSAWFLELVKPAYGQAIDAATYQATLSFFNDLLHLLHPFMPFITEELWQNISERRDGESIMTSPQTIQAPLDADKRQIDNFAAVKQVITNIRGIRSSKNISPKEPLVLQVIGENPVEAYNCIISKLANISEIAAVTVKGEGASTFMVGTSEYALLLGNLIDAEAEITKAQAELKHLEGFLAGVEKKLGNKRFVEGAPAAVVELERKKKADAETKIAVLKETLKSLGA